MSWKDIAQFIKERYYDDKGFWNRQQKENGFVKEWTDKQIRKIFIDTMYEFFYTKPIKEWGKQVRHRVLCMIKAIPLILDNSLNYPSKAEIARKSGFSDHSSAINNLVKLLRPNDYNTRYHTKNNRNPAKRNEIRQKISKSRLDKIKIDEIRYAIANYIVFNLRKDRNIAINFENIIADIKMSHHLKILKNVKFSEYIEDKIKQTINVVLLLIEPYFSKKYGFNQVQIKKKTNMDLYTIRKISYYLEKEFPDIYNHSERFSSNYVDNFSHKRKTSSGTYISIIHIKFNVCNYIFSKLRNNWNQNLNLNDIIMDSNSNKYLKILKGLEITNHLKNQIKKYIIAVRLMVEPYFSQNENLIPKTIDYIHKISKLDHKQIRQISQNFEKEFGKNEYNDLERFPIPQNNIKDMIKGYPREFFNPKTTKNNSIISNSLNF